MPIEFNRLAILVLLLITCLLPACTQEPSSESDAAAGAARTGDCVLPPPTRIDTNVNMPEYDTLTAELIRCLPDSSINWVLHFNATRKWEALLGEETGRREALQRLVPGLRMTWSTWWLEAETSNGGLDQYFLNTHGEFADVAIEGLKMIGADSTAEVTRQAYEVWKAETARVEKVGEEAHEDAASGVYYARIDTLTDRYRYFTSRRGAAVVEDLDLLRARYARAHPEEFIQP
jgi:Domain of unknown function (DUF4375)